MAHAWFFLALGAALSWGLNYVMTEKVLQGGMSVFFLMFLNAIVIAIFSIAALYVNEGGFKNSFSSFLQNGGGMKWQLGIALITAFMGVFFINMAIYLRNASTVSFVEISYPMFVVFFSWLFFREINLNLYSAIGAIMILMGSMLMLAKG